MNRILLLLLLVLSPLGVGASTPLVVDLRELSALPMILPTLAQKRVVFVGELHDDYAHHLSQLEVIRGLHGHHGDNMVIGLEFFQQPFQGALDDYVAGRIDEAEMLRRTEYLERWQFDYRLYRPILAYAREHRIPLLALNVPEEWIRAVAEGGLAALPASEQARVPELDRGNPAYAERIRRVFEHHPPRNGRTFEHFLDSQLLWDEGMAANASDYLRRHPQAHMVLLAGGGHLLHDAIPGRLLRRIDVSHAILLNETVAELAPDTADFILLSAAQSLPPKGQLGVYMAPAQDGVRVAKFAENSAAQAAGLREGDRIVALEGRPVTRVSDVHLALLDKTAGDPVSVGVVRGKARSNYTIRLH